MIKYICFLAFLFSILSSSGQRLMVELNGEIEFDDTQISIQEAGLDFPSSVESAPGVEISVLYNDNSNSKINPNQKWRIHINKSDMIWNSNLTIEGKRTGNGNNVSSKGSAKINDGESYQEITNVPSYFFRGRGEIANIPMQLRLSGISVVLGANSYETNIVFTVYEDW